MSDVLLEYHVVDDLVRVAAIDGESGIEAVLVGPKSAGRTALGRAAAQKLTYIKNKQAQMQMQPAVQQPGYWA